MRNGPLAEELIRQLEETYRGDIGGLERTRRVAKMAVVVAYTLAVLLFGMFLGGFVLH